MTGSSGSGGSWGWLIDRLLLTLFTLVVLGLVIDTLQQLWPWLLGLTVTVAVIYGGARYWWEKRGRW